MAVKYLTCVETVKLARKALHEAFPGVKFSVRALRGDVMAVEWTDGPCEDLVAPLVKRFRGTYFDSQIDYQGAVYHMYQGQEVRLGVDYVRVHHNHSDREIQAAINHACSKYASNLADAGIERPDVAAYKSGRLLHVEVPCADNLQRLISQCLAKRSDRLSAKRSATAANLFPTRDDGYSRATGAGFSAVPLENLLG